MERQISGTLESPADLWLTGVTLTDVLGEDDTVNKSKLDAVRSRATIEHPGWRKRRVVVDEDQGKRSNHHRPSTWDHLLRSGARE